jgi:hypothetical protein
VIGRLAVDDDDETAGTGIAAARKIYGTAVETAQKLWQQAKAGDKPDPNAARKIIDSLARLVGGDRTSLLALTALKRYDNYTFTHMVNVSVLAMAQARALNIQGGAPPRVRLRRAHARHRQGQHAAGGPEQARQADARGVRHHAAARRRRRAHPAAHAGRCRRWRPSWRSSTICARTCPAIPPTSGTAR